MQGIRSVLAVSLIALMGSITVSAQEGAAKAFDKLKKEMESVAKDTSNYSSSLNKTMQSLSKVNSSDAKNKVKAVKSFQKNAKDLNKDLKKVTDKIQSLRKKRDQYFSDWEQSVAAISNPDLQKASEDRRQKVMADHTQLTEKATAIREKIDDFMKEVNDLSTFLGNDPTPSAADAAKQMIDKVLTNGDSLAKEVQEISGQLSAFARGSS